LHEVTGGDKTEGILLNNIMAKLTILGNQSTRHIVKSCDELTVVFDGIGTSWPYFWPVTGQLADCQLADWRLADWTSRGLVNSRTKLAYWTSRGLDNSQMPSATLHA